MVDHVLGDHEPAAVGEQAGDLGVKTGAGFFRLDPAQRDQLVAYRDRAYAALGELIRNLGPSPHMTAAAPTDASESGQ